MLEGTRSRCCPQDYTRLDSVWRTFCLSPDSLNVTRSQRTTWCLWGGAVSLSHQSWSWLWSRSWSLHAQCQRLALTGIWCRRRMWALPWTPQCWMGEETPSTWWAAMTGHMDRTHQRSTPGELSLLLHHITEVLTPQHTWGQYTPEVTKQTTKLWSQLGLVQCICL